MGREGQLPIPEFEAMPTTKPSYLHKTNFWKWLLLCSIFAYNAASILIFQSPNNLFKNVVHALILKMCPHIFHDEESTKKFTNKTDTGKITFSIVLLLK